MVLKDLVLGIVGQLLQEEFPQYSVVVDAYCHLQGDLRA